MQAWLSQVKEHHTVQSTVIIYWNKGVRSFLEVVVDVAHTGGLRPAPFSSFMLLTDSQFNFLKKPQTKTQQCCLPNHLG